MNITKANNGDVVQLENYVDITDPCYDNDVWCRVTVPCKAGEYICYFEKKEDEIFEDCERIAKCAIIHSDYNDGLTQNPIDLHFVKNDNLDVKSYEIGVDAGLAGFFNNKPDFDDDEWSEFCDKICNFKAAIFEKDERSGFFTESGYGDGGYKVTCLFEGDRFVAGVIDFVV